MGPSSSTSSVSLSKKTGNKLHRQSLYVRQKRDREKERREARFRRKKEEARDPELRRARVERNQPASIDRKRVWDDVDDDSLGASVDVEQLLKRRRVARDEAEAGGDGGHDDDDDDDDDDDNDDNDDDVDSMLGSDSDEGGEGEEDEDEGLDEEAAARARARRVIRDDSLAPSTTSTNLDLTPEGLAAKFPSLFAGDDASTPAAEPKLLVTTTLNSTLHDEARLLCALFPNSTYIPRSAHRYGHRYSVREISRFAANRGFTAVMVLREDQKRPAGLDVVHLPSGPTAHFSISGWLPGRRIPHHGNPTNHYPELLLNNFKTPLGVLTARLFQTLFPRTPEYQGRQVVSFCLFLFLFIFIFLVPSPSRRPTCHPGTSLPRGGGGGG